VRFGDIFAVLPFSNDLVVVELSGAQIRQLLEQQWSAAGAANVMQVSHNFAYRWDAARPIGSRVVPESITLDGAPLVAESIYRVAVNDFMAGGGDGFSVLSKGRNHRHGTSSRGALVDYLRAHAEAPLPRGGRIGRTN
jgi:5'-nucleotidase